MTSRGHLNPQAGPPVERLPPPARVADLVRWFWVPEWDLPAGVVHRALVLTYATCNLVVDPEGVFVYGPSTRISHRDLAGRGWGVGALLLPAATPLLVDDVRAVVDGRRRLDAPGLARAVAAAMDARRPDRHAAVTSLVADWLAGRRAAAWPVRADDAAPGHLPDDAAAANRLLELVDGPDAPRGLDGLAAAMGVSARTVQRVARRYVGLTPAAMLRRRRLQDAAGRVRAGEPLAAVATDLGYSDQAHLTRDFREVLGLTPGRWRPEGPSA